MLAEIDSLLRSVGKSLKHFPQLPQPPSTFLDCSLNNLIIEETNYDFRNCNEDQKSVYHSVMESVEQNQGGMFFVYGSGGCGKTYLWRTIICKLRSEGKIVLPVASSGIAATLLPGGRTAHSRFKIPIALDDFSHCSIGHSSDIVELIKATNLIIWDEAPMQHRYAFECLDRSLRDIMKSVDPKRYHLPFEGITVVLGGDFRQILPVITHGKRSDIVSACITRSKLWRIYTVFVLQHNMRLNKGCNDTENNIMKKFAEWVLQIGDGHCFPSQVVNSTLDEQEVYIPEEFCNLGQENTVENMVKIIFPDLLLNFKNANYLSERAILTPANETVSHLNSLIVEQLPGDSFSYLSIDTAEEFGGTDAELDLSFPTKYLNSLTVLGIPAYNLVLKEGVVVMLMRNLNQTLGLCNGTRMIVTKCLKYSVECEVICGSFVGTCHFIPGIECCPTDSRLPFKLIRKQMPLKICYAMTINKSQGQSLEMVGLFLPNSVFTHGQLYVAISRVTSPTGLKLFINDERGFSTCTTQNVVYK